MECGSPTRAAPGAAQSFAYPDFSSLTGLALNGAAVGLCARTQTQLDEVAATGDAGKTLLLLQQVDHQIASDPEEPRAKRRPIGIGLEPLDGTADEEGFLLESLVRGGQVGTIIEDHVPGFDHIAGLQLGQRLERGIRRERLAFARQPCVLLFELFEFRVATRQVRGFVEAPFFGVAVEPIVFLSELPEFAGNMTAAQFIKRIRRPTRRLVAGWTGIYQYTIDQVLEDMVSRCRELKLRLAVPEDRARQEFAVLLTVQAMNYLHSGGHRVFL